MGNKKNRNPEKKERKRIEKEQQHLTFPVQPNVENTTKSGMSDIEKAEKYFNSGNAYFNKNDYNKTIKDYDEAIKLNQNYVEAYTYRGIAYRNKGDASQAIRDFNEAIELEPNNTSLCQKTLLVFVIIVFVVLHNLHQIEVGHA